MNKNFLFIGLFLAISLVTILDGCKQDNISEPLEPVSIVQPDSSIVQRFAGDSVPIQLKFTTDRPFNWVLVLYSIDTTGVANNYPLYYPDTLFRKVWNPDSPRVNLYTYAGLYRIPDTLKSYSVIYFDASFQAGSSSFSVGQNYPAGIVTGDKKFKINVR